MQLALAPRIGRLLVQHKIILKKFIGIGLLAILAVNLPACISTSTEPSAKPPQVMLDWQTRKVYLDKFTHWQVKSRIASADDMLGFSGEIRWTQRGELFDIQGAGPLGIGGFRAKGTPQQVALTTKDGTQISNNPERDMQRFGWRLPLAGVKHWMLGTPWFDNATSESPVPAAAVMDFDAYGRLRQLTQAGWTITYLEYAQQDFLGFDLPTRLLIEDGEQQYRLKMLVETWRPIPLRTPATPPPLPSV